MASQLGNKKDDRVNDEREMRTKSAPSAAAVFRKFKCCPLFQESTPRQCSTAVKPSNRGCTPFCSACVCYFINYSIPSGAFPTSKKKKRDRRALLLARRARAKKEWMRKRERGEKESALKYVHVICVRACARARARVCVCVCVCVWMEEKERAFPSRVAWMLPKRR